MFRRLFPFLLFASAAFGQATSGPGAQSAGGGGGSSVPVAGATGVVQNGLLAEYRILPSETVASLVDYSVNGNNATGTVGTAPTITAITGGIRCLGSGAVILPVALNSAKTIQFVASIPRYSGTQQSFIQGNATTSVGIGLIFGTPGGPVNGGSADMERLATFNGAAILSVTRGTAANLANIAFALDTVDRIYINGVDEGAFTSAYYQQATVAAQNAGSYQLCGSTQNNYLTTVSQGGWIYYAVFYNRVLAPGEVMANAVFMNNAMTYRGLTMASPLAPFGFTNNLGNGPNPQDVFVFDGDSLTFANGNLTSFATQNLILTGSPSIVNQGKTASHATDLVATADQSVDSLFTPIAQRNAAINWSGTNDCPSVNYGSTLKWVQDRLRVGWRPFVTTMVSRTLQDACKNSLNTLIRGGFNNGYTIIDLASDPNVGADGANTNALFFQGDNLHPTQNSAYNVEAPLWQRVLNRAFGNINFTVANTYASAAAAATTTTAGSESTNTVTITFAATPANCLVGNTITLAGLTPAGYNSTATNGASIGGWNILTRSGTQITYFNPTSGLGAVTVQGTGVCPQQQDVDQYQILNFGAGNYTLESCQGFSGPGGPNQNNRIFLKNINAGSSTIVPMGTETIDGAANLAIAQNQVRILESQLVSASASGCTWKVIQ